jgi:tyrosyl-tRNA synthetase
MIEAILTRVASVAISISRPPQEIMQWRESEFGLWAPLLARQVMETQHHLAMQVINMLWNPKDAIAAHEKAQALFTRESEKTDVVKLAAVARAEEISRLHAVAGDFDGPPKTS